MRTKFLSLLLCAALILSLAACGNNTPAADTPSDTPAVSTEPTGQQPSEQPSEEPAEQPGEAVVPSEEPSEAPSAEPTEEPSEEPVPSEAPVNSEEPVQSETPSEEPVSSEEPVQSVVPSAEPTPTPVHTHSYNSYKSNSNGTHTVTCTGTTGTCDAKTVTENCTGDTCSKCGYTKPVQTPVDIIPNGWDGVGVNYTMEWMDPNTALANMPNTKAVVDKYDLPYKAEGSALTVNRVALENNIIEDGLVLGGFVYSAQSPKRYEVSIALLKDVLDAESATALINWIEELDRLQGEYRNAVGTYGRDSIECNSAKTAFYSHGNMLFEATDYVVFGNVKVRWGTDGNVISLYIKNK